ncbi:RHS repeat-associated core domain-containing protein, partial [Yersinia sp. 2542 StPb PI]|uniref:RHS repeat-associated core domain-containing protein n=1 Tax=Yersinia sp. 2542 StPb PI TaxID=3117408 RepID=UPI003B289CCB
MSKNVSMSAPTPAIAISDNRGLGIRALAYNRSDASQAADELITCNRYNAIGQLIASRDARLEIDNFRYHYNLAGTALRTEGVDNGTLLQLADIEGRPVMSLDAKGTRSWVSYEPTLGRPLEHHQHTEGGQKTITDRFFYADNSQPHKAANLNGQCIRHYDTAGLQEVVSLSITGAPLQQQRRLLTDTLGPVNWFGKEQSWASRLANELFITRGTTDALGQPLTQTDAKGHTQQMAYNRAGQLSGSWLTLNGGAKQVIVASLTYSAAGQKLREESGNGVVTEYRYEAQTQRLIGIKTTRPALKDRSTLLQDLRYDYDPVGNILAIHNDAEATRFYRNQKIVPETTYRYDTLYQLIEATGRESDKNSAQSANLPDLVSLTDGNQYVNYTRRYSYDRAGNLLKIQHTGASSYTTNITVSDTSNHGIQQQDGLTAADIRSQFDAAGNQQQLQPGQPLQWDARNQLQQVITVKREAGNSPNNDYESYLYGGDGMRIVKQSIQQRQTSKVVYLPGLELRTQHNNDKLTEDFQVVTVGAAGRAQVRVLLWQHGKPDDIANNQLRYSFDNQIGSSLLELDHNGDIISQEEYYPFGGTAVFASRNTLEAKYKTVRYSGKERDATGLYYYGFRYYLPWLGRWLNADPAGTIDGLNLFRMVSNNPVNFFDGNGFQKSKDMRLSIAKEMISKISKHEPKATKILDEIAYKLGAELYGREYRLKTKESLAEKLTIAEPHEMNDVLRYTIGFPYGRNDESISLTQEQEFVSNVVFTLNTLAIKGYKAVLLRNTFHESQAYRGINANFTLPDNSAKFEIQIHTAQSFKIKSEGHIRYEGIRDLERGMQSGKYEGNNENKSKLIKLKENHLKASEVIASPTGIHEWIPSIGAKNLNFKWKDKRMLSSEETTFFRGRIKENMKKLKK